MIGLLRRQPFARHRQRLILRGEVCQRGLHGGASGFVARLRGIQRSAFGIARGQAFALRPCGGNFSGGGGDLRLDLPRIG
ncbi:MAG: hypothetical protein U1E02_00560, partial [Hydrogenophaga sp.]|nr:hypothetical protein [Hydrogenophaga sp.]